MQIIQGLLQDCVKSLLTRSVSWSTQARSVAARERLRCWSLWCWSWELLPVWSHAALRVSLKASLKSRCRSMTMIFAYLIVIPVGYWWGQTTDVTLYMNLSSNIFFLQLILKNPTDLFTKLPEKFRNCSPGILDEARLLFDLQRHKPVWCLQLYSSLQWDLISIHQAISASWSNLNKIIGKIRPSGPNSLI